MPTQVRETTEPARSWLDALFAPVRPASLGVFRICFGLFMVWHLERFMPYVTQTLTESKFLLSYDGFQWLGVLPRPWMVALFWGMIAAALLVALGLFFRAAIVALWLGWTYTFLLCQGHYNNHSYLFSLLGFLLIFTGANRWASLDRLLGIGSARLDAIPAWQVYVLRAQIVFVYFFAGIAKLAPDWLAGYPMRIWLAEKGQLPLVGPLLTTELAARAFSFGGLLFDTSIGFLLLSRRTRRWALIPLVAFHVTNDVLWNIGIFPWFMLAATGLFFDPDWPQRMLDRLGVKRHTRLGSARQTGTPDLRRCGVVVAGLALYLLWQTALPLRHFTSGATPDWDGEGSLFAWRMLTVDRAEGVRIRVALPDEGTIGYVEIGKYLNDVQLGRLNLVPKQYLRFAHFIRDEMQRNAGVEHAEIYVDLKRRLNERPYQQVFDPDRNLSRVEYRQFDDADYILPPDPRLRPGTSPQWLARASH